MNNPEKLATQSKRKAKQRHNTICVGHYHMKTQTTGGKDVVIMS